MNDIIIDPNTPEGLKIFENLISESVQSSKQDEINLKNYLWHLQEIEDAGEQFNENEDFYALKARQAQQILKRTKIILKKHNPEPELKQKMLDALDWLPEAVKEFEQLKQREEDKPSNKKSIQNKRMIISKEEFLAKIDSKLDYINEYFLHNSTLDQWGKFYDGENPNFLKNSFYKGYVVAIFIKEINEILNKKHNNEFLEDSLDLGKGAIRSFRRGSDWNVYEKEIKQMLS